MRRFIIVIAALSAVLWAAGSDATTAPAKPAAAINPVAAARAVPTQNTDVLNYQGALSDAQGNPVKDGEYAITFRLYPTAEGGSPVWTEAQNVQARGGGFNCLLGSVSRLPVMTGDVYLELQVGSESPMAPRTRIAAVPFAREATHARSADTAEYVRQGPGPGLGHSFGLGDSDWVRATPADSVLYTIHQLGIARGVSNNVLYGTTTRQTHVNLGVACTTGTSNQNFGYCTVGGGQRNRADSAYATVCGGGYNRASGDSSFVGGGAHNLANRTYATVAGGYSDTAGGVAATVGGGYSNKADSVYATVGGGRANVAHASYASVPGGYGDTCTGAFGLAAGDRTRLRAKANHTFAFGENCTTSTSHAVVFYHSDTATKLGVGVQNPTWNLDVFGKGRFTGKLQAAAGFKADTSVADSQWVTKCYVDAHSGGDNDWTRHGSDSVLYTIRQLGIARGGSNNMLYGNKQCTHVNFGVACTTGSSHNTESLMTVGGGYRNRACSSFATVGGGMNNHATGGWSFVGGGAYNVASNAQATVGGGYLDTAFGIRATVGGGEQNTASGIRATVGGGLFNKAGDHATVGGGEYNRASGSAAMIGGGNGNTASKSYATVAGGFYNTASETCATVAGGYRNSVSGKGAIVGGGFYNAASGHAAMVGGGDYNAASDWATVGGGDSNTASSFATVGGGNNNTASGTSATVAGGGNNAASGNHASVGGGYRNSAAGTCAAVAGEQDTASGDHATVAGGYHNVASSDKATVGGGQDNAASNYWATVGGGYRNAAAGRMATVGGGQSDTASADNATVGGGQHNLAVAEWATVGGGINNLACSSATVGGGWGNWASGREATVAGGSCNEAVQILATIGGGDLNYASGWKSTVSGGEQNKPSGNWATVGGGSWNKASGDYSWAVGHGSFGMHHNSAAFSGATTTADNQVRTQSLSAGTAVFTSDHPLDANGKLLNQYAMGSSELVMFYRGAATIGSNGRVQVQLPDYFEAPRCFVWVGA